MHVPIVMINVVVALHCEAKPLIAHYGLVKCHDKAPFELYEGESLRLIVCGIGKAAAAAAVGYLAGIYEREVHFAWLNVGIAGHAHHPVGEGFLVHKIWDKAAMRCWYPVITFDSPCESSELVTVDRPASGYEADSLVDMEASGFFSAACRFSSIELIHSYKVISDNAQEGVNQINEQKAAMLIDANMGSIIDIVKKLSDLLAVLKDNVVDGEVRVLAALTQRHRFTVTQHHQLRRLLQRWHAVAGIDSVPDDALLAMAGAKHILTALERQLNQFPVRFQ